MKSLLLNVVNKDGLSWISFRNEDILPFLLPEGATFEIIPNYNGVVESYHHDYQRCKFTTNILVKSVLSFQLSFFKERLLKNGWKIENKDTGLMFRDICYAKLKENGKSV
ncbi:MAG TPA: hypothetical protein VFD51_00260 [Patescibacteria group bacterium]|nr:hypothetical protein [Patescibacteria group bacterium]